MPSCVSKYSCFLASLAEKVPRAPRPHQPLVWPEALAAPVCGRGWNAVAFAGGSVPRWLLKLNVFCFFYCSVFVFSSAKCLFVLCWFFYLIICLFLTDFSAFLLGWNNNFLLGTWIPSVEGLSFCFLCGFPGDGFKSFIFILEFNNLCS